MLGSLGIRPGFGYPACPDHSEKFKLFDLLDARRAGIEVDHAMDERDVEASLDGVIEGRRAGRPRLPRDGAGEMARAQWTCA